MQLTDYRTLGRSGLVVSPLALGTMTFGTARWGTDEADSRAIFDSYVEAGGNIVDTADVYSGGRSEEMLGGFIADRDLRHRIVLSTKAGFSTGTGPHNGGAGARHIHAALEGSLRRLRTDHIDLYWLHVWDGVTPAGEVLETMAGLVRNGRIRHWGVSNVPAWWCARLVTLAAERGLPGPIALQYFYSLVNRDIEEEHVPLAADAGLSIVPWSPLAYGLLTGRYDRQTVEAGAPRPGGLPREAATVGAVRPKDDKRLDGANPFGDTLFTERNWRIVDELRRVAAEAGAGVARVALSWVLNRPGVGTTLIGASRVEQLVDNIAALGLTVAPEHRAALDAASAPTELRMTSMMTSPGLLQHAVFGGAAVSGWSPGR